MVLCYMMQRKILSNLRIEQSKQCLSSAELLFIHQDNRGTINRAYYAVFHAIRSILALEGKDFAKHSAVISYFRKNYIKTGIFPVSLSDTIGELFNSRSNSDYNDIWEFSDEETKELLDEANLFVNEVIIYINKISNN